METLPAKFSVGIMGSQPVSLHREHSGLGQALGRAVKKHLTVPFCFHVSSVSWDPSALQEPFKASLLKEQQIVFQCGYLIAEIPIPP